MKTVAKPRLLVTRFPFESRFGGEEVHTLTLMERLREEGYEVRFMGSCDVLYHEFLARDFDKSWWRKLYKPPVTKGRLLSFTLLGPFLFLKARKMLKRVHRRWGVDTVYMLSLTEKLLMTPWALRRGMRVIWLEHARIGPWLTKNPWRWWYSYLSRKVDVVVTSNAMVEKLPFAHNVKAISCGVILDKADKLPDDVAEFLKDGFCVGTVARLTVDKGVDMMAKLVDSQPVTKVIVVGSGPLEEDMKKAAQSERFLWVDKLTRPQLTALYEALDLFVLASTEFDPFGMVAAESMMVGTPVVVTDECGIAADLEDHKNAVVVPAKFSALDKAVKQLSKNEELRKKLGRAGQRFAKEHYTLDLMTQGFIDLLENKSG